MKWRIQTISPAFLRHSWQPNATHKINPNIIPKHTPKIDPNIMLNTTRNHLKYLMWGPIICGPGPFFHWGPRPEPRKVIAEDR